MKRFVSIFFLICAISVAQAQYDPSKVKKKAMELYDNALEQAQDGKFKEGIQILNDAVKIDVPDNDDADLSNGDKTATFPIAGITQINIDFGGNQGKSLVLGDFLVGLAPLDVDGNSNAASNATISSVGVGLTSSGAVPRWSV